MAGPEGNNPQGNADQGGNLRTQAEVEEDVGDAFMDALALADGEGDEQADQGQTKAAQSETEDQEGEQPKKAKSNAKADAEEETSDDEQVDDDVPDYDETVQIKLKDGTKVTLGELMKSPLLQADYTRKTQELSEQRKAIQSERQALTKAGQELQVFMQQTMRVLQDIAPQAPDPKLAETDVAAFVKQKAEYDNFIGRLQAVAQGSHATQQHVQQLSQSDVADLYAREMEALAEKVPELAKPETRKAFLEKAVKYTAKIGVTPEEIAGIMDHRHIAVLNAAVKWWELQDKKMEAVRKAKVAPPLRSAPRQAPGQRQTQQNRAALDRLKNEHSREALMEALTDADLGL